MVSAPEVMSDLIQSHFFFLGKDKVEIGISRFPLFTLFHFTDNQISFEDILVAA